MNANSKYSVFSTPSSGKIQCGVCFHKCLISDGKYGICKTRSNKNGKLILPYFGIFSGTGIDPIEKKPLYHYKPGSSVYSIGYWGCNLSCPFCQNWQISQELPEDSPSAYVSPEKLVSYLESEHLDSVCHTYSEPSIHIEYLLQTAELSSKHGIKNLLVTNGSLTEKAADLLYKKMAAVNIDLKSMNADYYSRTLNGDLACVKSNIEIAVSHTHVEVTSLIVPNNNDTIKEIKKICIFLKLLEDKYKKTIPLHLSMYFPRYKETRPSLSQEVMIKLQKTALKYLQYVYLGNMSYGSDTLCSQCKTVLIKRNFYNIKTFYDVESGTAVCKQCGEILPITL